MTFGTRSPRQGTDVRVRLRHDPRRRRDPARRPRPAVWRPVLSVSPRAAPAPPAPAGREVQQLVRRRAEDRAPQRALAVAADDDQARVVLVRELRAAGRPGRASHDASSASTPAVGGARERVGGHGARRARATAARARAHSSPCRPAARSRRRSPAGRRARAASSIATTSAAREPVGVVVAEDQVTVIGRSPSHRRRGCAGRDVRRHGLERRAGEEVARGRRAARAASARSRAAGIRCRSRRQPDAEPSRRCRTPPGRRSRSSTLTNR